MHEGLGQNLLIFKDWLYLAQQGASGAGPPLEEISPMVSRPLHEVRETSHDLRPYQFDRFGLTRAEQSVIWSGTDSGVVSFQSAIAGIDGLFPPGESISPASCKRA